MYKINFLDLSGRSIFNLTQWDMNQQIIIESQIPFSEAPMVHFCNKNSTKAICTTSELINEYQIKVNVPNTLLTQAFTIYIYVFAIGKDAGSESNSGKVILNGTIPIKSRIEPDDFIYEENIHVVYLSKLEDEILALNEELSNAESIRVANENERIANESIRTTSESERCAHEDERMVSENTRIDNEKLRQVTLDECQLAIQNAETATNAAYDAAEKVLAYITGDVSDKTVTFSESTDFNNISSGDSLEILFGKIQKYLSYIDNNLNNLNNPITQTDIDNIFKLT